MLHFNNGDIMNKDNIFLDNSEILINSSQIKRKENITENISVTDVLLNKSEAKKINKNPGRYITISFNKDKIDNELEILLKEVVTSLKEILKYLKVGKTKPLFVGLGNKDFACDKFGSTIIEKIVIDNNSYKIYKNVLANTNIDSTLFIKNLASSLNANVVIVFDSLKAENLARLGSTIQIATTGLSPGSAFNSKVNIIDNKTIKKPVICIGIPTIVSIKESCENKDLVVTTNDIDLLVDNLSSIVSIAINRLF